MEVLAVDGKLFTVRNGETDYEGIFNKAQVKPYFHSTPDTDVDNDFAEILHSALAPFVSDAAAAKTPMYDIYSSEVIKNGDPRKHVFGDAKRKEIQKLIKRDTWEVILRDEAPNNANIMGAASC